MKTHLHRISMRYCAVLALTLNLTLAYCQSSPSPIIQDYDNTSLPVTYQINSDTTFCKGRTITIHGQYFKRATSGELWDTTQVFLGANGYGRKVSSRKWAAPTTESSSHSLLPT
jgi:hypothetical protein